MQPSDMFAAQAIGGIIQLLYNKKINFKIVVGPVLKKYSIDMHCADHEPVLSGQAQDLEILYLCGNP